MKRVKIKSNSIGLAALRNELGFSQELLALYLKVNLSTLKMAEAGHRPLPTDVLIKVAELQIRLAANPMQAIYEDAHHAEETCPEIYKEHYKLLALKQNKCVYECALLERRLKMMVANYYKARKRLETMERLMQDEEANGPCAAAWQNQKEAAIGLLNRYGKPTQALLQARISLLNIEIKMYNELRVQAGEAL